MNAGTPLHGLIVTLGLSSVSEMLCLCGFDWLWIDMEHAPLSLKEVQEMAQAKCQDCAALVRVPSNSEEWIKRVLDLGVEGLIIPHVNTAASQFDPRFQELLSMAFFGATGTGLCRQCRCFREWDGPMD